MKRWGLIILVCAVSMQVAASAYRREMTNFFAVEVGAGYQALLTSSNTVKPGEGAAVNLGVGYRYANRMLLLHIGLEGQFGYMTGRLGDWQDSTIMDQSGLRLTRVGQMYQRREARFKDDNPSCYMEFSIFLSPDPFGLQALNNKKEGFYETVSCYPADLRHGLLHLRVQRVG